MGPTEDENEEMDELYAEFEQELADEAMDEFDTIQPGVNQPIINHNQQNQQYNQQQTN